MIKSEISELLAQATLLKPKDLIISDLKWKYLLWGVHRRKNILLVGYTRCGKTTAIKAVAKALDRPFFEFNLGSTQDARAVMIGNTTFHKDTGTVFHKSEFVKSIQTPNAVVLLDELTRASHDCWNILMPVLDETMRFLRLDEQDDSAKVNVENVTFLSTANIGAEYTATKVLDRALAARFPVKVEMQPLNREDLLTLIGVKHPNANTTKGSPIWDICSIATQTVEELKKDEPRLSTLIPTGTVLEMAQLSTDGFTLEEIAETVIYPDYPDEGGADSERTYIRQLVQKYVPSKGKNPMTDPIKKIPV